jgi:3-hydroxybutyryl-CoA dehydrogenase
MTLPPAAWTWSAMMDRYRESGDRNDLPWPLMAEMYARGEWGRKTGKGFYTYDDDDPK